MTATNAFYAHSGGVTAVINATACGLLETARQFPDKINKVLVGRNGIYGALREELIDTSEETVEAIAGLKTTPGSAFGTSRVKLKSFEENREEYERLIEVFKAHDIGYFFYNGGGDSHDTIHKLDHACREMGFPLVCIGIPKTIDNDLPITDCCPGFGSVAKYVATSTLEASLDVASMAATSTQVFVFEVMGRHTGWIAASAGLAKEADGDAPHIILLPERAFAPEAFLAKVKASVVNYGYCTVVVSEGVRSEEGQFISDSGYRDAFGHAQLGGVAPVIAHMIREAHGYKYHWAVADYLQRSARHIASKVDVEQAYAMGRTAVEFAMAGKASVMVTITRESDEPYQWSIGEVALGEVANIEKTLPDSFITADGFGITEAAKRYLRPLIEGESYPAFKNGLPCYTKLKNKLITKKLCTA